jgi:hypothetical protein
VFPYPCKTADPRRVPQTTVVKLDADSNNGDRTEWNFVGILYRYVPVPAVPAAGCLKKNDIYKFLPDTEYIYRIFVPAFDAGVGTVVVAVKTGNNGLFPAPDQVPVKSCIVVQGSYKNGYVFIVTFDKSL